MPTDVLTDDADPYQVLSAALAEIERREGYEIQLRAALAICTRPIGSAGGQDRKLAPAVGLLYTFGCVNSSTVESIAEPSATNKREAMAVICARSFTLGKVGGMDVLRKHCFYGINGSTYGHPCGYKLSSRLRDASLHIFDVLFLRFFDQIV